MVTEITEAMLQQALAYLNHGENRKAEQLCLRLLRQDSGNTQVLTILGLVHCRKVLAPHLEAFSRLKRKGFIPHRVLDIGAYEGSWSQQFLNVFPDSQIMLFEAQPGKTPILEAFCQTHKNCKFVNAVLGEEDGKIVPFHIVKGAQSTTGSSLYQEVTDYDRETIECRMASLDKVLEDHDFKGATFLKLDVQGAEIDVLKGGMKALAMAEFVLLELSLLPYNVGAPLADEIMDFMKAKGFVIYDILEEHRTPDETLFQVDFLFVKKVSRFRRNIKF